MVLLTQQIEDIPVVRVRSDTGIEGAHHAFDMLESRMGGLKGRKMYGVYYPTKNEYSACVMIDESHPDEMGFERWTIPGGLYSKAKLDDWMTNLDKVHTIFKELEAQSLNEGYTNDTGRPSIEFYRSTKELICLFPIKKLA